MLSQVSQVVTGGEGNTIPPPSSSQKRSQRWRKWCFTINNPDSDTESQLSQLFDSCEYAYQLEVGDSGTPHYQGMLIFKNAVRFNTLKKKLPTAHLEKMRGTTAEAYKYCTKVETRIEGPWTNMELEPDVDPQGELKGKLRLWQVHLLRYIDQEPDNRSILWICDEKGGAGKTSIARHIYDTRQGVAYIGGKATDMKYAVACMKPKPKIIIINLARSVEHYVSYAGIEEIKDGIYFSGKYESQTVRLDCPHIIVMANFLPEYDALSSDRWITWNL